MPIRSGQRVNQYVVGVDGCRGGWVAVRLTDAERTPGLEVHRTWAALMEAHRDAAVIAVDMPIGLVDDGRRPCDVLARERLGWPRSASVFAPPRRPMLGLSRYDLANAWGKAQGPSSGGGLSRQAWGLMAKIRELDAALEPADQARVIEAHPELLFQALNGGSALAPKRSAGGMAARRRLLTAARIDVRGFASGSGRSYADHDALDAAAVALVARRRRNRQAVRLAGAPERDGRGLKMEIWY